MNVGDNPRPGRNQAESLLSLALRVFRGELTESQAIDILKRSEKDDLSDA